MTRIQWTVTGRQARYSGTCEKCGLRVDASRPWETVLLTRGRSKRDRTYAVAHAKCAGGGYGGVNKTWRGQDTITLIGDTQ